MDNRLQVKNSTVRGLCHSRTEGITTRMASEPVETRCVDILDRCLGELKAELAARIEADDYSSVAHVASVIKSVGQCRERVKCTEWSSDFSPASMRTDSDVSFSAPLSTSGQAVVPGPAVIARSTKATFHCTDDELLKVGNTKDGGKYTHRVAWHYVFESLSAMLLKRSEWSVPDICKYANESERKLHNGRPASGELSETHVYLVLAFLNAYQGGSLIQGGSRRGSYKLRNKDQVKALCEVLVDQTSALKIYEFLMRKNVG